MSKPDHMQAAYEALVAMHHQARKEGFDFNSMLTSLMASVTAEVGGIEALIASRSGSWEAVAIAGWMDSAGCHDPEILASYRRA